MKRNTIRITESELRRLIKEAVGELEEPWDDPRFSNMSVYPSVDGDFWGDPDEEDKQYDNEYSWGLFDKENLRQKNDTPPYSVDKQGQFMKDSGYEFTHDVTDNTDWLSDNFGLDVPINGIRDFDAADRERRHVNESKLRRIIREEVESALDNSHVALKTLEKELSSFDGGVQIEEPLAEFIVDNNLTIDDIQKYPGIVNRIDMKKLENEIDGYVQYLDWEMRDNKRREYESWAEEQIGDMFGYDND